MKLNRIHLIATTCVLVVAITSCSAHTSSHGTRGTSQGAVGVAPVDSGLSAPGGAKPGSSGTFAAPPGTSNGQTKAIDLPALQGRDVISTASLTVEVSKPSDAAQQAAALARGLGGYVASEIFGDVSPPIGIQSSKGGMIFPRPTPVPGSSATLVLRVPSRQFEILLSRLNALGTEVSYSRSSDDVTQQVVDIRSRLASQEASIARLRALMSRATSISDVTSLEGQLAQRESDLESMKAQQQSLSDQTALATITLSLQSPDTVAKAGHHKGFTGGLRSGWDTFTSATRWVVEAVGALLPFALLFAVIAGGWHLARRRSARV